jgi:predicted Zn-dependent protease
MSSTNQPLQALEASIQLARQNYKEAKIDSALQHIKEGLQIDEHNAQSLETAASTHLRFINDKEAIKYAQQLITHHPRNPYGYSRHAQALLQAEKTLLLPIK